MALVYQGVDPPRFRATLGVLLALGATLSIAATWVVGRFGPTETLLSALIVPASFLGFWLSRYGLGWGNGPRVRVAVDLRSEAQVDVRRDEPGDRAVLFARKGEVAVEERVRFVLAGRVAGTGVRGRVETTMPRRRRRQCWDRRSP